MLFFTKPKQYQRSTREFSNLKTNSCAIDYISSSICVFQEIKTPAVL